MLSIIGAFIVGGCLCGVFQIVQEYTKANPAKIMVLGIAGGAFLTAIGIMGALSQIAPGGTGIMVIGFGSVVYAAAQGILAGTWTPTVIVICVVLIFWAIGCITGAVHYAMHRHDNDISE